MKVLNFTYNGIFGHIKPGYAPYTAEFLKWTDDPGIAIFKCSDGKDRPMPTFTVEDFDVTNYPEQILPEYRLKERASVGMILGTPCHS